MLPFFLLLLSAAQWTSLFDGKTLQGWVKEGTANFRVVDGAITVDQGQYTWLRSEKTYRDYELKLEFKTTTDGNSGVFLRSAAEGLPHITGYELQIFDQRPTFATGAIVDVAAPNPPVFIKHNEWNQFEVRHVGPRILVKLNGKQVLDCQDSKSLSGHIGLQFNPGKPVSFRKIEIRNL
ncbi:3-keto-disaccharide hydrolase [Bryobacter aggregatus]|uniref:3-keto-disaccharide hydrolase n=1 Tax=Bryobacter aggregatus TaxID=360054 RepID=UPI0009B5BB0A|nr:DUF1080 domain-containing protein [Bryobacter aggregatus]